MKRIHDHPLACLCRRACSGSGRQACRSRPRPCPPRRWPTTVRQVAPALERYRQVVSAGDLWKRPDLSPRDRSLVTVAALVSRNQTVELPLYYLGLALDHGVKPGELSELITHLALYCRLVQRHVGPVPWLETCSRSAGSRPTQLPAARAELLAARRGRRGTESGARVGGCRSRGARASCRYTAEALFHDLWLRPDLAPRDRSLVTVSGTGRQRPGRADPVSLEPRHGQRPDEGPGIRGADAPAVLRRLAQRLLRGPGRQGRVRKAPALTAGVHVTSVRRASARTALVIGHRLKPAAVQRAS